MPEDVVVSPFGEPESSLVDHLAVVENFSLAAVTVIVGLDLLERAVPALAQVLGNSARPMSWGETLAVLLFTISLQCTQPRSPKPVKLAGVAISILLVAWSVVELVKAFVAGGTLLVHGTATAMITPQGGLCFVLLGTGTVLVGLNGKLAGMTADFLIFCMAFVVAVLATGHLIGSLPFYGPAGVFVTSEETLLCASFFALVVFIRRATHGGVFAILMGSGIGSKIARALSPFVVLLPYIREAVRAHFISLRQMPSHYTTAIMATMIMSMTIFALMYVAWRMNAMEAEIQGLSLRDPLTGLNNLRGFRLLAEQALLMAYRSDLPFSVLYVDVDNLKQINDAMGHQTGSEFLAEMASILREVFRETDVVGRLGGDEFAVAGQFGRTGIGEAAMRLQQLAAERNLKSAREIELSFSIGWVTLDAGKREPLADLLARADNEMYKEKRRKKVLRAVNADTVPEPSFPIFAPRPGNGPEYENN